MTNFYWSVYKNLERELIELSNQIHFDDKQLSIYSVKISELLIRCVVEIESISKDLFLNIGGEVPTDGDLYFDTDCIQLLEENWLLSKKKVIISAQNFYFLKEENKILTPLKNANKRGTSSSHWKRAYQAVKHNRVLNLKRGNIKNLLRALAALYVLNLYFKDNEFDLQKDSQALDFNESLGSEIFSIKIHIQSGTNSSGIYNKKPDFDECIYFTRTTEETAKIFYESINEVNKKKQELVSQHLMSVIQDKLKNQSNLTQENSGKIINQIVEEENKKIGTKFLIQAARGNKIKYEQLRYESILNKNQI